MRNRILALCAALALLLALSACGRSVDVDATGAKPVPGARALHYFCHGPTLIYVTIWESTDDEYEAMWPGWCVLLPDGRWVYPVDQPDLFPEVAAQGEGNTEPDDK